LNTHRRNTNSSHSSATDGPERCCPVCCRCREISAHHSSPTRRAPLAASASTDYKVAATAFDCIRGTGPAYFKHVCTPASDISGRAHLRSAERRDMLVPRTRTELGRRSIPGAAPTVWNSLLV